MAEIINGTYQHNGKTYDAKTGQVIGSPTPLPTPSVNATDKQGNAVHVGNPSLNPQFNYGGIVSSAMPSMQVQSDQAMGAAAQTLAPQTKSGGLDFYAQQILNQQQSGLQGAQATFSEAMRLNKLDYDITKAQNNFSYANALKDLSESHRKAVDSATQTAISLNPYSQAKQGSTAKNFTGKLDQIYQDKERVLQQQADLAQQALDAGNQRMFSQAQQAMNTAISEANSQAFSAILGLQSEARAASEFNMNFQQKESQFNDTLKTKYSDDYRTYLTQIPYSPEQIETMSDEELMMTTAGRLASQAGLGDPAAIRRDMSEASFKAQQVSVQQQNLVLKEQMQQYQIQNMLSLMASRAISDSQSTKPVSFDLDAPGVEGMWNRAYSNATQQGYSNDELRRTMANAASYIQANDIDGLRDHLVMTATKGLGVDEQRKLRGRVAAMTALEEIRVEIQSYKDRGGDTNIVKGTLEQIAQKAGATTDPDLAKIANRITTAMSDYRLGQTGVAFNKEEGKVYKGVYPSINNIGELNIAKIDSTIDGLNSYNTSVLGQIVGTNEYKTIFSNQPSVSSATPSNPFGI